MSRLVAMVVPLLAFACSDSKSRGSGVTTDPARSQNAAANPTFKPRCGTQYAPSPSKDGSAMCFVPAGELMMGSPDTPRLSNDRPPRKVRISRAFYIDQYEVTLGQFARFLKDHGNHCGTGESPVCYGYDYSGPIDLKTFEARAGMESLPVEYATQWGAAEYCKWAGKRLPTEAEWELAARHDPVTGTYRTYPWGNEVRPGITNHFAAIVPKRGKLAPIGTFKEDVSAIGAFDLGGNASEWVADCLTMDFSCGEPCVDPIERSGCEEICTEGNSRPVCEPGAVKRGGDTLTMVNELASKHRISAMPSNMGGVRCVRSSD